MLQVEARALQLSVLEGVRCVLTAKLRRSKDLRPIREADQEECPTGISLIRRRVSWSLEPLVLPFEE